jgi:endopeptidase Clp ATP-binding regulatory subunit ClpX
MSDDEKKRGPSEFPRLEDLLKGKVEFFNIPMGGAEPEEEAEPPADAALNEKAFEALRFDFTPTQLKAHLDRFVIGQDEAKKAIAVAVCDHYNQVRRAHQAGPQRDGHEYIKQNVILLGPTGVGKTYLIRILAQLIGVPFVKADITKFSETGYVGGDVDDLVRDLVRMAGGNVELAEYGIIFLDEIDKVASASNMIGRDVSGRGVQTGLLKLLEETEVSVRSPTDFTGQLQDMLQLRQGKKGGKQKRTINTRYVLFVASGAFTGLPEIIERRLSERNIGFGAAAGAVRSDQAGDQLAHAVTRDFVEYGFEPEFIGRLPIRVALRDLTEDDLYTILTTSEGSILKQHVDNFQAYGIDVRFQPEALRLVATKAMEEKTGARGLMTILESSLRPFKFRLPGTEHRRLLIDERVVEDPGRALDALLRDPEAAGRAFTKFEIRRFEEDFTRAHGVRLALDPAAMDMAVAVAKDLHLSIGEYLETVFRDHVDFLRKLKEETGRHEFPVTPQVLNRPGDGIELWAGKGDRAREPAGMEKPA